MENLTLIKPTHNFINEIRSYRNELIKTNAPFNGDSGLKKFEDITAWITQCKLMETKETVPDPEWVESEQFMLVRKNENYIIGMINFRHCLNDYFAECGGHIGYGIRPSERKKGYATNMLSLCLEECRKRNLNKVLITCNTENAASRKTIISCGGVYDRNANDNGEIIERYYIYL